MTLAAPLEMRIFCVTAENGQSKLIFFIRLLQQEKGEIQEIQEIQRVHRSVQKINTLHAMAVHLFSYHQLRLAALL